MSIVIFEGRKQVTTLHVLFFGIYILSRFSFFPISAVQKSVLGKFSLSSQKIAWRHASQYPNAKFSIWPFFRLVTLTLNMLTEGLGLYLKVSQTWSMLVHWLISIWYGCIVRQSQIWRFTIKHFDFDLTCEAIGDPDVNNIEFPPYKCSRSIERCFVFVNRWSSSSAQREAIISSPSSCYGNTPVRCGFSLG